jgi:hypothetical protein
MEIAFDAPHLGLLDVEGSAPSAGEHVDTPLEHLLAIVRKQWHYPHVHSKRDHETQD